MVDKLNTKFDEIVRIEPNEQLISSIDDLLAVLYAIETGIQTIEANLPEQPPDEKQKEFLEVHAPCPVPVPFSCWLTIKPAPARKCLVALNMVRGHRSSSLPAFDTEDRKDHKNCRIGGIAVLTCNNCRPGHLALGSTMLLLMRPMGPM